MQSLLITGGAGFIGSNFTRHVAQKTNANIVVLDALTYAGNLANVESLIRTGRIHFVRGDVCDVALARSLFRQHDITTVVHFAAESHVDRSIVGPAEFLRTNIHGTYVLLEAAREAWSGDTSDTKFLHVSTDEVFGEISEECGRFSEATAYNPSSPYSASKAASDHLARAWNRTYGVPVLITNCSNNYGPWQFPEKLIPLVILNALEGRDIPVYGDGLQVRDWLHVDDHCTGIMALLEGGNPGETYLLGGNCERRNIDVVHAICDAVDSFRDSPPGTSRALVTHVRDRPGHDRRYAVDPSKISQTVGWGPVRELEEAIPGLVRWYDEHEAWTSAIRSGAYVEFYARQYEST